MRFHRTARSRGEAPNGAQVMHRCCTASVVVARDANGAPGPSSVQRQSGSQLESCDAHARVRTSERLERRRKNTIRWLRGEEAWDEALAPVAETRPYRVLDAGLRRRPTCRAALRSRAATPGRVDSVPCRGFVTSMRTRLVTPVTPRRLDPITKAPTTAPAVRMRDLLLVPWSDAEGDDRRPVNLRRILAGDSHSRGWTRRRQSSSSTPAFRTGTTSCGCAAQR